MKEKRRSTRVELIMPVILGASFYSFSGEKMMMRNISNGGICISSGTCIPGFLKQDFYMKVNFFHMKYIFKARVGMVWERKIADGQLNFYGVKFIKIDKNSKETLREILNERIKIKTELSMRFVKDIKQLRDVLEGLDQECAAFDCGNPSEEKQIGYIKKFSKNRFKLINEKAVAVHEDIKFLSRQESKKYLIYFQDQILYYFLRDGIDINKHLYYKPLGYAGDYIMANYLYEDIYGGRSTYSKFMWRYTLENPLARAHKNRRKYFYSKIKDVINSYDKEKEIRISSFGCGPAIEMIDVLKNIPKGRKVIFTCIDAERKALEYVNKQVSKIASAADKKWEVRLENENILNLVRGRTKLREYSLQDFIYCAGFLDYLSDRIAKKTIVYFLRNLKKNAKLIVVNVSAFDSVTRFLVEIAAEWFLYHRTTEQMLMLVAEIADKDQVKIEHDWETGKNIYLTVIKK